MYRGISVHELRLTRDVFRYSAQLSFVNECIRPAADIQAEINPICEAGSLLARAGVPAQHCNLGHGL
jgi:hypothetical protein